MDDIENYCFRLSRSQGMSYLRASRCNYDTMSIFDRSYTVKTDFCSDSAD